MRKPVVLNTEYVLPVKPPKAPTHFDATRIFLLIFICFLPPGRHVDTISGTNFTRYSSDPFTSYFLYAHHRLD